MSWLAQIIVGVVLLYAGTAKLLNPEAFRGTLRLSHVPDRVADLAAPGIPAIEVAVGLALIGGDGVVRSAAFVAATLLLVAFMLWMAVVLRRGLSVSCACFGVKGRPVTPLALVRNGLLAVLAVSGALADGPALLEGGALASMAVAPAVAVLVALVAAFRLGAPELLHSKHQLEGIHFYKRSEDTA